MPVNSLLLLLGAYYKNSNRTVYKAYVYTLPCGPIQAGVLNKYVCIAAIYIVVIRCDMIYHTHAFPLRRRFSYRMQQIWEVIIASVYT